jgi:hypothetical protein
VNGREVKLSVTEYNLLARSCSPRRKSSHTPSASSRVWGRATTNTRITCAFTSLICARSLKPTHQGQNSSFHRTRVGYRLQARE